MSHMTGHPVNHPKTKLHTRILITRIALFSSGGWLAATAVFAIWEFFVKFGVAANTQYEWTVFLAAVAVICPLATVIVAWHHLYHLLGQQETKFIRS